MIRHLVCGLTAFLLLAAATAFGEPGGNALVQRNWFETRTASFNIYSCASTQEVSRLAARLEQFREAYSNLAGTNAVASPSIVVMAFPDHKSMEPYLPLYQGKPVSLAAFFHRGSDENLIVLGLSDHGPDSMEVIFHEYTHLLLRHNDRIWPIWLKEGMAEIYSTFDASGHGARIGLPISHHLRLLSQKSFMPLKELFAVDHDSPQYNEQEHQGIFYAEAWLLTHYLMLGDNPGLKARFGQLTTLLRQGQKPEQAFTNAFQVTLPQMEAQLHRYLERGRFEPLPLLVKADLSAPRSMVRRGITPSETSYWLGNELLRVNRPDAAEPLFTQAQKLAPTSPLPYEGLGMLAAQRKKSEEAVRQLKESLQRGSTSFLAHYVYARERFHLTADAKERYTTLSDSAAKEIRSELEKSIGLMPNFGPAHQLLGFFELVQGENLAAAEEHLRRSIQLEPENQWYSLALAQAQMARKETDAARRTLEPLRLPNVEAKLREHAEELFQEIGRPANRKP
ncbi:MAG: repeat-containing protein [Pedosphaera sp.]|nr:repeat-containing protein [Pedosphaera sp.]